MDLARLRRHTYISHMALGYSGALFFVILTITTIALVPEIRALLAHGNAAGANVVTATGIWGTASGREAHQLDQIAHDTRASIAAIGRDADKSHELLEALRATVTAHVNPLVDSATRATDSLPPAIGAIGDAATAGTRLIGAANTTLDQVNDRRTGITPLMRAFTADAQDLHTILKNEAIGQILTSFAGMAKNGNLITGEFQAVTKKATDDYLGPHPWYTKVGRFSSDAFDYGALAARHIP